MTTPTADRVVDALITAQLVDPGVRTESIGVVSGVLVPVAPAGSPSGRGLPQLVEVVAYLGGALVLAAGGLFLAEAWDDLGFGSRVTMLAVVAAVLAVAGGVASRVPDRGLDDSRRRLAGTLLTGSALAVTFLVGLLVDHAWASSFGDVDWTVVAAAGAGVLVAAVGYRIAPTAVGQLALLGGVVTVATELVTADHNEGDVTGVVLLAVAAGWLVLSEAGWFRELVVARSLGVSLAVVGAQVPVIDGSHTWFGYALTALVAVLGIALYLARLAWPYLTAAVIAVTLVVPEAVSDWTEGSFGAIGGVLVTGITLLLASLAGYQLRERAVE